MAAHHSTSGILRASYAQVNNTDGMRLDARIGFRSVACELLRGAKVLAEATPSPAHALVVLCGQILECTLKAHLVDALGIDATGRVLLPPGPHNSRGDKTLGHDLKQAWLLCAAHGLPIASTVPRWVSLLHDMHAAPYHGRYMIQVQGFINTQPATLIRELEKVLAMVK